MITDRIEYIDGYRQDRLQMITDRIEYIDGYRQDRQQVITDRTERQLQLAEKDTMLTSIILLCREHHCTLYYTTLYTPPIYHSRPVATIMSLVPLMPKYPSPHTPLIQLPVSFLFLSFFFSSGDGRSAEVWWLPWRRGLAKPRNRHWLPREAERAAGHPR